MITTAIILVGGLGSRLKPVVNDVPKPMAPINGRPFLEYQLGILESAGIKNIIFATGYKSEVIQNHFKNDWGALSIRYSHEQKKLGTGGAIIQAVRQINAKENVLILNGDTLFPISLDRMQIYHQQKSAEITIAVFNSVENMRYGSLSISSSGRLQSSGCDDKSKKSAGIYLLSPDVISELASFEVSQSSFESDLTPKFLSENKKIFAYFEEAPFIDIGVPEDFKRAGFFVDAYLR